MTDDNIIYLKKPKRFTLTEAKQLLPKVKEITHEARDTIDPLIKKVEATLDPEEHAQMSAYVQSLVNEWADQIQKLGVVPKGLWLVDFDSGEGYFCWQHDDEDLLFFHGYNEGYTNRVPIQ